MTRIDSQQKATTLAVMLMLTVAVGSARGLDDGGGRSVFAYGAGNRALALGGAYAAVADDASAVLWNPGGLGFVDRKQFQATHTDLFGLGFSEQYAAFVLPSWRWGVASVIYRGFSVDGIEHRDDRNVLLPDELTDTESEIDLAYGRRLNAAWSVGGAVKLQRQNLAGYSDTGLGVDLGLMVRPGLAAGADGDWAQDLSLGIALRNAIEPSIRLDEEATPDPTAVRAGLAYAHSLGAGGSVLAALDIEKTSDMNARVHAGLELRLVPLLVLRTGLNDGTLAAGTGIKWREFGFDYAFEDNPLGEVHRFGVTFTFGTTVEEDRLAALVAEESELQTRLNTVFEQRNQNRIEGLLAQAQAALDDGRHDEVLDLVAVLKVLDPADPRLRPLEAAALREKGFVLEREKDYTAAAITLGRATSLAPEDELAARGLARVRQKSDRLATRSAEIRHQLDLAMDAFAADQLLSARDRFAGVLELEPGDGEAKAMLARTEEAIRHRAANLTEQALALLQAGQLAAAENMLGSASEFDPAALGLAEATAQLTKLKQDQRRQERQIQSAAVAAQPPVPSAEAPAAQSQAGARTGATLTEAERQEVADLYRRGMEAAKAGRTDEALRYWEFVWSADPEYKQAAEHLKREYLTRGMEAFAAGRLNGAVDEWEKALLVDPSDERTLGYLARARQQLSRVQKILGTNR